MEEKTRIRISFKSTRQQVPDLIIIKEIYIQTCLGDKVMLAEVIYKEDELKSEIVIG